MTDEKCYVFGDNQNALTTALLSGGGMNGGMWNNPIWAIVFLAALRNGGIFGNNGAAGAIATETQLSQIQDTLNTNQGNTLLMDAIKGNSNSIHELATTLNCNQNAVLNAINCVQSAIASVSNQVGMSGAQVINAIQSGNMALSNTLQSCCCNIRQDITKMGYDNIVNNMQQSQLIQNGFSQIGYASAEQTCAIKQAILDQTIAINGKLDAQESARKDREIASLTAELATVNARAERQAELAPIVQKLNDIACKQPNTVTTAYSPFVAVPNCMAAQMGLYGNGWYNYNGGGYA